MRGCYKVTRVLHSWDEVPPSFPDERTEAEFWDRHTFGREATFLGYKHILAGESRNRSWLRYVVGAPISKQFWLIFWR